MENVYVDKIDEYPFNTEFVEGLDDRTFYEWRANYATPLLLDYGWPVYFKDYSQVFLCQGHQPGSYKFYADGSMTICDAMQVNKSRCNINETDIDHAAADRIYADIKEQDPLLVAGCSTCPVTSICGGRKWCDRHSCSQFPALATLADNRLTVSRYFEES